MESMIECKSCGNKYHLMFSGSNEWQGHKCACVIEDDEIQGCYGSVKHDTNVYKIIGELPDWVKGNILCDSCVNKLLRNKNIKLYKTSQY